MPFTDTASAPYIQDDKSFSTQLYTVFLGLSSITYSRTITTTRGRHTCLTQAAADSIAEAKNDTYSTATSQKQNATKTYQVVVTSDTYGPWVAI